MDQLAAMRAFVRVVEAGTFTRAASTLELPKATVTKLIQGLEAHIRTKLLHRTTRRVTVTPDGADYYERVLRLLADIDDLDGSMTSSQARPSGRLRVDVSASLALLIIIPALPEFHARYPEIQLYLGVTDQPVDLIGENVDCSVRAGGLTEQSLIARRIGELHFITCAAPGYLERHGEPAHPLDLSDAHQIVSYFKARNDQSRPFTFSRGEERHKVHARYAVSVNDGNAYVAAGVAGLGLLQAPTFLVRDRIASGELRQVLPDWSAGILPLHVVFPPNRHISNRVRVFVDWVADLFAEAGLGQRAAEQPARGRRQPARTL
jgi:DNA-binding transcriptional LysR family regulator